MSNPASFAILALGIALAGLANILSQVANLIEISKAEQQRHAAYDECMKQPTLDELVRQYHCLTIDPSR